MSDAWDELRARLGPAGDLAARALVERLKANERFPTWECSLHLAGSRGKTSTAWVEPADRIPLTTDGTKAQNP